ncbi:hypothetical protein LTR36_010185 [Oleoguttula mirabilis]|uniref:Phosphoglycerate mutase-like protein n=1 Tax=Oleoguttula mirabilis TaxID=1507867 RepID=A0AAV9JS46_9PEZI|nr:hypothetical protein LTR36_010185 [Oleoguttula mirabilis]
MRHQGGNSPWIPKVRGILEGGMEPPAGCRVDQVHMISRHAERYPTVMAGIRMLELFQHLQAANLTLSGDLAFTDGWDFFIADPAQRFENVVATGPCAGTLEAFAAGVKLRTRYEHLLVEALATNMTSFWASDSLRVIETARYFGAGFFGIDWKEVARLHVIPETPDRGADTLTPGRTCLNYRFNVDEYGHDYGIRKLYEWREAYLPPIIKRLGKQNPDITFNEAEVYSMQEFCGFETIAKGSSRWCDVFTHEEWESFEYARDLLHYYRAGPGNPYSGAMGWLWLNATANLLLEGPGAGPLYLSFVHDGDIIPLLSALDLFPQVPDLPASHVMHNRTWRTSDIVPMGGRLIFERLACPAYQYCWDNADYGYPNHIYCSPPQDEYFVRINVNDGIVALPGCDTGPGSSCPLGEFVEMVKRRGLDLGDFRKVCGLEQDATEGIGFLHQ